MFTLRPLLRSGFPIPSACLCAVLLVCGCKTKTVSPDDAAIARGIQAQLNTDSSLAGQPVTVAVAGGVATLTGSVLNDAQKTIAARDAAGTAGLKEVVNNLSVGAPPPVAATIAAPLPVPIPIAPVPVMPPSNTPFRPQQPTRAELAAKMKQEAQDRKAAQAYERDRQPAPIERPQQAYNPPPAPIAPLPPSQPSFRNVSVPAGTTLPVRVTQTLDSATTQEGDSFSGVVASDVIIDGATVIAAGSAVSGHVDVVHEAAHFKGSSLLTVSLATLSRRGERLTIATDPYSVEGKGRGKNTAEKAGGGAAVGAILGGIFGGGKGAAIGAAAGGGLGAGANAVTRGQQVQIPSETVVRFHLSTPLSLRVRTDQGPAPRNSDGLQSHTY